MEKTETVFVTKYALSGGVQKLTLEISEGRAYGHHYSFFGPREYFHTWPEALADAERRRGEKIASLKKQIAKLEKMKFEEPK